MNFTVNMPFCDQYRAGTGAMLVASALAHYGMFVGFKALHIHCLNMERHWFPVPIDQYQWSLASRSVGCPVTLDTLTLFAGGTHCTPCSLSSPTPRYFLPCPRHSLQRRHILLRNWSLGACHKV